MASKDTATATVTDQQPTPETVESTQGNEQVKEATESGAQETKETTTPSSPVKKPTVHKQDYETDKVYLYQFGRSPTIPSVSPYCLKAETFIRMAGINYENVEHKMKFRSKKGLLPFVELNGREIPDSDLIIKELSEHFNVRMDENLTPEQQILSHALESMINNHTVWVFRCWRSRYPDQFLAASKMDLKRSFDTRWPRPIFNILVKLGFRNNLRDAIGHGIGRHSMDEIYELGKNDLTILSKQLGDNDFFFGSEPHLLDCVAFSHLAQFVYVPFDVMYEFIKKDTPNLLNFVERMKNKYWSNWDEICSEHPQVDPEEAKKKEEAAALAEEKKKLKEEKKRKLKEEKEKKRLEREQAKKEKAEKEKAAKEKAAAEKAEKEKKEKEEKEAAAAAAAATAATTTEAKPAEEDKKDGEKKEEPAKTEEEKPKAEPAAST